MQSSFVTVKPGEGFSSINKKIAEAFTLKPKKFSYRCEADLPHMSWIAHALGLRRGGTYLLTGYSNAGKTFLSSYLSFCIHNNLPILGMAPDEAGNVLHLDWDLGEDAGLYQYKVRNGLVIDNPGVEIEEYDYLDMRSIFHLNDSNAQKIEDQLVTLTRDYTMVVVDSLIAAMPGTDINDDRCRTHVDLLNRVASRANTCIVLLHHDGKNVGPDTLKKGKGSSSIMAAVRGSLSIERKPSGEIFITTGKKRLSRDFQAYYTLDDCGEYSETLRAPCGLRLNPVENSTSKPETDNERLCKLLRLVSASPCINTRAITHQLGKSAPALALLKQAIADKLVSVSKKGQLHQHSITQEGIARLQYEEKPV